MAEEITTLEELYRAKWTAATRKSYHKEHPENFAGPDMSYPIKDGGDVKDAWNLAGHADNPDAVRRKIKSIAKRLGLEGSLPDTAKEEDKSEDRTAMATPDPLSSQDTPSPHGLMTGKHNHSHTHLDGYSHEHEHEHSQDAGHDHPHHHSLHRAANHEPMKGKHSHAHPAFGSQGDDSAHDHEHEHNDDADHHHPHESDRVAVPALQTARLYAPIVRIDPNKREVEGVATSEAIDSFGTIFSYEASKKAFQRWMERTANVREMHDKKAVGKGIGVRFDDAEKKIYLRTRISRGATDTWLKIEDGVLNGYSVGATNYVWGTIERDGKKYPYLTDYELAETSLVDNASNPDGQGLIIARADGLTELVDITEDTQSQAMTPAPVDAPPVERTGARVSSGTRESMHDSISHTLHAAASQMRNCGCDCCVQALAMIDPDNDNDIDLGGYDDADNDADELYANKNNGDMDRMIRDALERIVEPVIARLLSPVYTRQQQFLARCAQIPELPTPSIDTTDLEERLTSAIVSRVTAASSLSEVHASLSEQMKAVEAVKETVERIAAQPAPGGPVLNGGGYPVDKRLANQPQVGTQPPDAAAVRAVLDRLQASGALSSVESQTAAASLLIQPMPGRRG